MERPKTIFCDIDGCILYHFTDLSKIATEKPQILPGVIETFHAWDRKGYKIILTTGRKESMRELTESHLQSVGIVYDQLVMGLGGGKRILINDLKPDNNEETAIAVNLERNKGFNNLENI